MVDRICLGVVVGAHGVHGLVRVKSFTAAPGDIAAYGPVSTADAGRTWTLSVSGTAKGVVLCRLEGVADRSAAEALRGTRLYVPRAALPPSDEAEEEYYHADLIGLAARREDGSTLGTVHAVHDFGAGDMLEVRRANGETVILPFTHAAVPVVDLERGLVTVSALPGLLDVEPAGDNAPAPLNGATDG